MSANIYAALEIGTTRTVLAVGEAAAGGRLKLTCHAEIPSTGVRKSQILDIRQATQSIRSVLRDIEKKQLAAGSSITIGNAFLVASGQHIKVDHFQGQSSVSGSKVNGDDINDAMRAAHSMALARERELLDIVDQDYELDDIPGIVEPKGMSGRVLKLNTLQIHADSNRINDARTAAGDAHLEIRDPLFAASCAGDVVLGDGDRRNGALAIDLGGGSTGYAAYVDGYLASAGVIGVGGDHVTNDIAYAFQTTQAQAEELKKREASAVIGADDRPERVKIPGSSPLMESRTISRRALDTVVGTRLRELFQILRKKIEGEDLLHRLHSGVFLTGGGAALRGIEALVQRELGMPAKAGIPVLVDGLEEEPRPESFAAVAGALLYAHRNCEEKSLLQTIFGGFMK